MSDCTGPRLKDQLWRRVTVHAVHLAFVRAEWNKIPLARPEERQLIEAPDLTNVSENNRRRELLYSRRAPLLAKIPRDTAWHEVQHLERTHLEQLFVIGRCDWDDSKDKNELSNVAKRKHFVLETPPARWSEPILWGHSQVGPFTILEGNHRLVAYAGMSEPPTLKIRVYVGLSRNPCFWHLRDHIP
jgi:hypothetical protein